ncbi:phosphatase PAP2 family protein [Paracidovorax sp. MALMAid1276]|uniref:phosphatase PAP2 family protein n=1 Tax=Paracidovorax sp. MALMAid1276 TaxID=3411631 RepID=UPI003B9D9040
MTTDSDMFALHLQHVGALLARHPLEGWLAGLVVASAVGALALVGVRAVRRRSAPLRQRLVQLPMPLPLRLTGDARWVALVAAMAASACALVLAATGIAQLAESGRPGGGWGALDDTLAQGLREHAGDGVLRWFAALTHLGDAWALTAGTAMVAAGLWLRQHRLLAVAWLVALAGNGALTRVLKRVFERVRPEHAHGIAEASGYSFPSGHSSASMVAYTLLAYLTTRLLPRAWHLPAAVLAAMLVFTIGWSRVVLHVHYASDVLAGWLLGATWMVCTVLIVESVARWRAPPFAGPPAAAIRQP